MEKPWNEDKELELFFRSQVLHDAIKTICYKDQIKVIGYITAMVCSKFGVGAGTSNIIADNVETFIKNNIDAHSRGVRYSSFEPPFEN